MVNDILQLAEQCREIRLSHVGRQGNRVAHILAQHNRDYDDLRVWMEKVSQVLSPFPKDIPSFPFKCVKGLEFRLIVYPAFYLLHESILYSLIIWALIHAAQI